MPLGAARFGLLGGVADLGKLELIETQTVSSASALDFTDLGNYNVHFISYNNIYLDNNTGKLVARLSNNGGTSFISTSTYQWAVQYNTSNGSFGESKTTADDYIIPLTPANNGTNITKNGYVYFYNLSDSSKYSFCTTQSSSMLTGATQSLFGSGVLPTAETHNAIRLMNEFSTTFSGTVSLYGIAES